VVSLTAEWMTVAV